jgi:hypothetical protein
MQMNLCECGRDAISSQISPALGPEGTPAQDAQQQGTSSCMFSFLRLESAKMKTENLGEFYSAEGKNADRVTPVS